MSCLHCEQAITSWMLAVVRGKTSVRLSAVSEMVRVLRPGGRLVALVGIARGRRGRERFFCVVMMFMVAGVKR